MSMLRKLLSVVVTAFLLAPTHLAAQEDTHFVRYEHEGTTSYGVLVDETVHEVSGDIFSDYERTGEAVPLAGVKLLAPVEPGKVIAVGLNYRSHLGQAPEPEYPGLFTKYPSSIVGPDHAIVRPADSENLHYEAEMVVVIGATAKNVSVSEAPSYVFGVTAGNDVSERDWQSADLQWFRAKASDTFGPIGPVVVRGLEYDNLAIEGRVNGDVHQSSNTSDLIFDVPTIVSYLSRYVTLEPGDVIFTGTPGSTRAMEPGDIVEIELEGVGVLRNTVVAAEGTAF